MTTELIHATLALIADALEAQNVQPLHAELARSVITTAGPPSPGAVQAMVDRAAELVALGDGFDAVCGGVAAFVAPRDVGWNSSF
jgi:hypothetical protein